MSTTVTAINLKPGMIARRVTLDNTAQFRVVDEVMSAAPYYGKVVVFTDGNIERVVPDAEFEVSTSAAMPSLTDVIAGLLIAYATAATN